MTYALLAMSHSPLLEFIDPGPEITESVEGAFKAARKFVNDFDPDLIVNFGPDHYNGFFYDIMPPFCIGCDAVSIGDYGSQAGPLDVPSEIARDLAGFVIEKGLDTAISLRMEVDHGGIQPIELMFGDIAAKPVIPIFINSVAPPFTPMQRIRLLGEAVGEYFKSMDKKVLFVASGGLSHDPPVPRIATATPEQRAALLGGGRNLSPEARAARQERVISAARMFAAGEAEDVKDIAPEWDREFMEILAKGDLTLLDSWKADWMTDVAGNSSHEVRTWVAAYAALGAIAPYDVTYSYYRPIKEFIAGFGVTTATHK